MSTCTKPYIIKGLEEVSPEQARQLLTEFIYNYSQNEVDFFSTEFPPHALIWLVKRAEFRSTNSTFPSVNRIKKFFQGDMFPIELVDIARDIAEHTLDNDVLEFTSERFRKRYQLAKIFISGKPWDGLRSFLSPVN